MAKFQNHSRQQNQRPPSGESIHLGTFMHTAGDLLVLKLDHRDIPYPNAPVLQSRKQIGKIDEVFGPVDDVYVSVRLDSGKKSDEFSAGTKFEGYREKFMSKDRFLPREQVERNKQQRDKQQKPNPKKRGPPPRDMKRGGSNAGPQNRFTKQRGKFDRGSTGKRQ